MNILSEFCLEEILASCDCIYTEHAGTRTNIRHKRVNAITCAYMYPYIYIRAYKATWCRPDDIAVAVIVALSTYIAYTTTVYRITVYSTVRRIFYFVFFSIQCRAHAPTSIWRNNCNLCARTAREKKTYDNRHNGRCINRKTRAGDTYPGFRICTVAAAFHRGRGALAPTWRKAVSSSILT